MPRIGSGTALLLLLIALPSRLEGQCALSGSPVSFEPHPPGVSRPGTLSSGFNSGLMLFQPGGSPYRLLMEESHGYSVLDLTTPTNPTALIYHDLRYPVGGPNSVRVAGDGQSLVQTIAVSPDGVRAAFSMTGLSATIQTAVGSPSGNGFTLWGDFYPKRSNSTLVQHIGSRYIAYDIHPNVVSASDVTTLPGGSLTANNLSRELTTWLGGGLAALAGNYILYQSSGTVRVIDASSPGPIGSITASYPQTSITNADFPGGRTIASFTAAVDPAVATKVWVLVELNALAGENSPSYGLLYVTKSGLAKTSAGPTWRVPSQAGEVWLPAGMASALIPNGGDLFVLMWAARQQPTSQFLLYSTMVAAWASVAPSSFAVSGTGFALPSRTAGFGVAGTNNVYMYVPTTVSAYVIPMSCVSVNSPAVTSMTVADQAGAALNSGDSIFLGEQITITPSLRPAPVNQLLTGFAWNFDFDFHPGALSEDNGACTPPCINSPRIKATDNGAFGNPATPPAVITVVGPCDPQVGGTTPGNGSGCWNSVRTNGAFGGPDFTGAELAGATKPLTFAFEANNHLGSSGASLFTLNWMVPAARLQSTQVLSGLPLVSGSDGHPTATGFKWYFGVSPAALTQAPCSGPTCVPTLDTRGTYYYWLTASYANGYVTPDYAGSTTGTYTVTDFMPSFTVNGSASGPITAVVNQNVTVVNGSRHGAGISATYQYSLCLTPCTDNYQAWSAMTDPPTSGSPPSSATIPIPGTTGTYALKVKVNYTGGTAYWPDPAGVNFFTLNAASPLVVSASVDPTTAVAGLAVTFSCSATGGQPPYSYQWYSPLSFAIPGATQPTYTTTSFVGGGVQAYCFVTDSQPTPATSSASATATFTPSVPVSASVSASPNPVAVNHPVTFSCSATGGLQPYFYQWHSPLSFTIPGATQQTYTTTSSAAGNVQAWCFVTDSQPAPATSSGTATATFTAGGPYSFFVIDPCRVLDTRNPAGPQGGPAIQPAGTPDRSFAVASSCGIPSDAQALSVNVTATDVLASGVASIYRGDGQRTGTNTVAFVAGRTRANNAFLQLATDGSGTIKVQNISPGAFDLIIDVNGYFR